MELELINKDGIIVIDSREVARMVEKEHKILMRDIRTYIGYLKENLTSTNLYPSNFFIESSYTDSKNQERPCYLLTKKGCDMVANKMSGSKGVLFTAMYVTKFEEMENKLKEQAPKLPTTYKEALLALVEEVEKNEKLEAVIEEQKPLVTFAEKCIQTDDSILVRELAKIIQEQGIKMGEKKLYQKLREWGLILQGKTEPSQKAMDMELFEVIQRPIKTPYGDKLSHTTMVLPKGQVWIVEKLMKELNK